MSDDLPQDNSTVTPAVEPTPQLDESVSERTAKNFEALKEKSAREIQEREIENETLRAEIEALKARMQPQPTVEAPRIDPILPENYPALGQQDIDAMVDKATTSDGYVDEQQLKKLLREANMTARLAMMEAKRAQDESKQTKADIERKEQERQQQRAFKKYPELNPANTDKFDSRFYREVAKEMAARRAEGKSNNLIEAIKEVKQYYNPEGSKEVAQVNKKQQQKEEINALDTRNSQARVSTATQADLAARMRSGSIRQQRDALRERLAMVEKKAA